MRIRRVQFDAYSGQFRSIDKGSTFDDDFESYVIPDFSTEDFVIPEDLDILDLEDDSDE